jgi:hypothetical protein
MTTAHVVLISFFTVWSTLAVFAAGLNIMWTLARRTHRKQQACTHEDATIGDGVTRCQVCNPQLVAKP